MENRKEYKVMHDVETNGNADVNGQKQQQDEQEESEKYLRSPFTRCQTSSCEAPLFEYDGCMSRNNWEPPVLKRIDTRS